MVVVLVVWRDSGGRRVVPRDLEIWEGVFKVRRDGIQEKEGSKAMRLNLALRYELLVIWMIGVGYSKIMI